MGPKKNTASIYDQYFQITQESIEKYGPQTILFYQVGAFFEMYGSQHPITKTITKSRVEDFTQTAQLNMSAKEIETDSGDSILMAGFRDYSLDKYLKVATQNGYTAVVYIQNATNPKAITRDFYGVYSPGTFISYDTDTSPQLSNNVICIWLSSYTPVTSFRMENTPNDRRTSQLLCGISSAHIFTGKSSLFEYTTPLFMNPTTFDELERYVSITSPSEAIIISFLSDKETQQVISYSGLKTNTIHIISMDNETNIEKRTIVEKCQKQVYLSHILSTFFGTESFQICQEFQLYPTATQSFCYLLHFLQERNPDLVKKMMIPHFYNSEHRVILANHTLKQLNIIDDETTDGKRAGQFSSVSSFLNKCSTPMGRRAFQRQITNPTCDIEWLEQEYNMTSLFMTQSPEMLSMVRKELRSVRDLEKICRQIVVQKIFPHTIYQLYESVSIIANFVQIFSQDRILHDYFSGPAKNIETSITEFISHLSSVLFIDKCRGLDSFSNVHENIFRSGNFENLDKMVNTYTTQISLFDNIRNTLNKLMQQKSGDDTEYIKIHETEKSGVSLQLTKKRAELFRNIIKTIPILDFATNKTETKDIRFVKASTSMEDIEFPLLTDLLKKMLATKEQMVAEIIKNFSVFLRTLEKNWYDKIEEWIEWTIRLDILHCKTYIAQNYNYCRPSIRDASCSFFEAKGVRHVLIEHIQQNEIYVANDLSLSNNTSPHDGILIFGTNAVGKTSFIRAIGISIIMAQTGLFVPCSSFVFYPYNSIFSRILGNDNLFKGLSTFAVEMSELRVILKSADNHSLVLGDELCSGTEMESALSLFSAGLVELCQKGATFLFATHFHEITSYDEIRELSRLGLTHMSVRYDPSSNILLYDRLLKDGQGNRMYGLEVCRSLYMEQSFLDKAYQFRNKYFPDQKGELGFDSTVYNSKKIRGKCEMCCEEIAGEIHHLAAQQIADKGGFIGGFHKNHPGNLLSVCEKCHLSIHAENKVLVKKKTTGGYKCLSY